VGQTFWPRCSPGAASRVADPSSRERWVNLHLSRQDKPLTITFAVTDQFRKVHRLRTKAIRTIDVTPNKWCRNQTRMLCRIPMQSRWQVRRSTQSLRSCPRFMDTLPSQTISRIFDVFSGYHLAQNGVLRFVNKLWTFLKVSRNADIFIYLSAVAVQEFTEITEAGTSPAGMWITFLNVPSSSLMTESWAGI